MKKSQNRRFFESPTSKMFFCKLLVKKTTQTKNFLSGPPSLKFYGLYSKRIQISSVIFQNHPGKYGFEAENTFCFKNQHYIFEITHETVDKDPPTSKIFLQNSSIRNFRSEVAWIIGILCPFSKKTFSEFPADLCHKLLWKTIC